MITETLRLLRKEKNLKQIDLANYLGVSRTTYTQYETGKSEPDLKMVQKLADFFGVTVDYLLGRGTRNIKEQELNNKIELTAKDMKAIKQKAENIKMSLMASVGLAFDGKIDEDDEDTLAKVMAALEEGMILAKKEAKEKYTPNKYKK